MLQPTPGREEQSLLHKVILKMTSMYCVLFVRFTLNDVLNRVSIKDVCLEHFQYVYSIRNH